MVKQEKNVTIKVRKNRDICVQECRGVGGGWLYTHAHFSDHPLSAGVRLPFNTTYYYAQKMTLQTQIIDTHARATW